ncbi:ABC transporter permease [Halalkaliarchaeum desulfuricum]|nr:ABC transporter permease [Halalkaliarchaeum desulfuricum]
MALAASVVAGGIGIAFVATMMGLEVTANRRELATLAVVGFSARSRALVVTAEAVTVTVAGGLLGVALGAVGLLALNAGVARAVGVPAVGTLSPWIVAYGLGIAILIGIVTAPYLSYLGLRTDTLAELSR